MPRHLTTAPSPLKLLVAALTRPASRSPAVPPLPSRLWYPYLSSYLGQDRRDEGSRGPTGGRGGSTKVRSKWPPRKLSLNVAMPAGFRASILNGSQALKALQGPGVRCNACPWPGRDVGDGSWGGFAGRQIDTIPSFSSLSPSQVNRDVTPASSPEQRRASPTDTETTGPAQFPLERLREPARTAARLCRPNHSHRHLDEQDLGRRPHAITRPPRCAIPPSLPPSAPALVHNSNTRPNASIATHRQHWQGRRLSEPAETAAGVGLRGMSQAQVAM